MKFVRILVLICVILFVVFLGLYSYLGGFHKLVPFDVVMGPYTIVYFEHTGDYRLIGQEMGILYDKLEEKGIDATMGIGIYYDDPMLISKDELRSEGGVVIDMEDIDKLDMDNYKIKKLEKAEYSIITFPFKNKLSYIIGVYRVYPVLLKYLDDNNYSTGGAAIEMYDMEHNLIYYMFKN